MPTPDPWQIPVETLRGVGPERAAQLARLEIQVVGDLLEHRPRRHEDRRYFRKIAELELGESSTTCGQVVASGVKRFKGGTRALFELILEDASGRLHCRWWGQTFMQKNFQIGDQVLAYGKLLQLKPRTMDHPETEVIELGEEASIHMNRIAPVYPLTEGLPQRFLRSLVWRVLEQFGSQIPEPAHGIALPGFPSRAEAFAQLHFPKERPDIEQGRQRLALDEFVTLQLAIQTRRKKLEAKTTGLPCAGNNFLIRQFLAGLGFAMTEAQSRVLREIRHDLGSPHPMRRLLQGDVGSGKTVVAACSALMTLESGFNVALMAPTEILAEQHYRNFQRWFAPLPLRVELRTGSRKTEEKDQPLLLSATPGAETARPRQVIYIGTHALIEAAFQPENLGLVIIDEQHKFGVGQRETLLRKGRYPHLLVMTATPIPRTLGLTLYGDLDSSVIDQMPVGRGKIKTFVRTPERLPKVWEFIRQKLNEGRQAYVVYPRVEEEEGRAGVKAVTREWEKLKTELAPFKVGLLHGRLKPEEKEQTMAAFNANQLQVLLATSVIEVGVDVPNASIMLIENAEQFGLAQLHQLRGRIGRGAHESFCILITAVETEEAKVRLGILEQTIDGFRIAEEDLKLRGPGELLGQQQSGLPALIFGDLAGDRLLVEQARERVRHSGNT